VSTDGVTTGGASYGDLPTVDAERVRSMVSSAAGQIVPGHGRVPS
jgi:hypothetical protein